ncbi:MAG: DNA-3-methyladenine glycosylase [Calditrichaeota bacterium]|nr:MAG: DNA-3-methyladenine glycosylase [Calditrichota bacterium]
MSPRCKKLPRSFYERDTLIVAEDILGKYIIYQTNDSKLSARIVEVEAYIGKGDPACHAHKGMTKRNEVMFGKAGHAYIYFIYGMYHCLNFVTEREGFPAAVLLRAAEPVEGLEVMRNVMTDKADRKLLAGPGLFCKVFGLSREQNGLDLTKKTIYLEDRFDKNVELAKSARIGISEGKELEWRFYDKNSPSISRK